MTSTNGRGPVQVTGSIAPPALRRAVAVALLCCVAPMALAQETGGTIGGTITDSQRAVLPGVTVTLRNEATNASLTTTTNAQGHTCSPSCRSGATS